MFAYSHIVAVFLIFTGLPLSLHALPQDLDVFIDFENATGEGDFVVGDPQNSVRFINFRIEVPDNPSLLHSGTKSLVLIPGEEGVIRFERGVNDLQFYAAETEGGGRIEVSSAIRHVQFVNGVVEGLPTTISSSTNPDLQSFIAFSGDPKDTSDLNITYGLKIIFVTDIIGQFAIDDLGYTYSEGPSNNTVFFDFESFSSPINYNDQFVQTNFSLGLSPITAHFQGGSFLFGNIQIFNHTFDLRPGRGAWFVDNDRTGTITFETPAAKVQFYAMSPAVGDAELAVFDTEGNLLTSTKNIPQNISVEQSDRIPFDRDGFIFNAKISNAPGGIGKITYTNGPEDHFRGDFQQIALDDFGFTPLSESGDLPVITDEPPKIITQPVDQELRSGSVVFISVEASGAELSYQWFEGESGDISTHIPFPPGNNDFLIVATQTRILNILQLTRIKGYWVRVSNFAGSVDSDTVYVTIIDEPAELVIDGSGEVVGENIIQPNGEIYNQVLLTGPSVTVQTDESEVTRVSFLDINDDIVQVEISGSGLLSINLNPSTFEELAFPTKYNQEVEYVKGHANISIEGADSSTFLSVFSVGSINAVNQALFPEGEEYDAMADVALLEISDSISFGGILCANTRFNDTTGDIGLKAEGVPVAGRVLIGDIDASGDALPHLLFGSGSFTVPAPNPGLRITGGDLVQSNGSSIIVAPSGLTTPGFETLITQNNFKSDNTPQPTQSINASFIN